MAFLDKDLFFNTVGTPWTFTTGSNVSPNVYDTAPLGTGTGGAPGNNAGRDLGVGSTLWWDVLVDTAFVSAGGATATFELVTDKAANLTTTPATMAQTTALGVTSLTAKTIAVRLLLPESLTAWLEFVGVIAVVGTSTFSAGGVESKLYLNIQANKIYQPGFTVY